MGRLCSKPGHRAKIDESRRRCLAFIGILRAAADAVEHDSRERSASRAGAGKDARRDKRRYAAIS